MKHQVPRFLFCFLLMFSVLACAAVAFTPEMPELSAEAPAVTAKAALSEAAYGAKPAETTDDGVLVFFDNGNADDRINLTNISLQGVVEPFSETDGFRPEDRGNGRGATVSGRRFRFLLLLFCPLHIYSSLLHKFTSAQNSVHNKFSFRILCTFFSPI